MVSANKIDGNKMGWKLLVQILVNFLLDSYYSSGLDAFPQNY